MMDRSLRKTLIAYLAALAMAVSVGAADPKTELLRLPSKTVADLLDDADADDVRSERAGPEIARLLVLDSRPEVRAAVAGTLGRLGLPRDLHARLIRRLARDDDAVVRAATVDALIAFLEASSLIDRIDTTVQMTLSRDLREHAVLASALGASLSVPGADSMLEMLSESPSVRVRRQAMRAVGLQAKTLGPVAREIASARAADPDRKTRRLARKLLHRLA